MTPLTPMSLPTVTFDVFTEYSETDIILTVLSFTQSMDGVLYIFIVYDFILIRPGTEERFLMSSFFQTHSKGIWTLSVNNS